ncbi:MAG TPA: hypothetical protein VFG33_19960 [Kribbella sp.]|uniref:hypothetical protein n=1 Tax=Kribbella sp. TaxID=1871183 RepID=UPI002D77B6EE|nr:hypothetical protein [Kribbella sp.]HET6295674.1 hypothetical protein [Kribbella sp.]
MVSIRGRYEYDDDDLTPGKKKEGGLHQNLFDSDGNLKGSARFIPEDPHQDQPSMIFVYNETAPPLKSKEQEAFERAVSDQLSRLVDYGIAKAKPTFRGSGTRRLVPPSSRSGRVGPEGGGSTGSLAQVSRL